MDLVRIRFSDWYIGFGVQKKLKLSPEILRIYNSQINVSIEWLCITLVVIKNKFLRGF